MSAWAAFADSLSASSYLAMGVMVLAGAAMQGVGGLGYAMFCAPLAAIFFPELVPGPLLAVGAPLALLAYLRERDALNGRVAAATLVGRVIGTFAATGLLVFFSASALSILFAVLILIAVTLSTVGWRVQPTPANLSIAGVASGIMGTITAAGGPPFAIAMQHLPPSTMRSTLGVVFFAGTIVSISALAWVGKMGATEWLYGLVLLPWMLAGFFASNTLARHISKTAIRQWLLGTAAVSACVILLKIWL
ncbi:MAG: sulfite exporter TauE/SafE family protein [Comamonas sp.]